MHFGMIECCWFDIEIWNKLLDNTEFHHLAFFPAWHEGVADVAIYCIE